MATYLPEQIWGDGPNISDADRDKYFDKEDNGSHDPRYTLKEGYEARSLGRGEKPSKLNSLATYTNDFDSLHDEYDPNTDRENYGIFKTYPRPESTQTAQTVTTPSDVQPEVVAETPPAVVEQAPVVREPVKGVDYMSSDMQDAYDRIQNYNSGFSADKWIADTSKPDEQSQAQAQALRDQYTFEIKKDLKPTGESIVNALTTAIPNKLGVFAG